MRLLDGLRVVEFGPGEVTARAGQFLADNGADVMVIDPPGHTHTRALDVFLARGKTRKELDLGDAAARVEAAEHCREADVVLTSWRPGVAERFGLDAANLLDRNPGVIHGSVTGFGDKGPWRDIPGYEALVMAKAGSLSELSILVDRAGPAYCAMPYASFTASQQLLHGVLAALVERVRSGRGQAVSTSLLHGLSAHDPWGWMLTHVAMQNPDAYRPAPPVSDDLVPNQGFVFRLLVALTSDGRWLQFSQTMPHLFEAFMRSLGLDWMFDDPEWAGVPDLADAEKRVELWERMLEAVRSRSLEEWQRVFEADGDIWAEVFRQGDELLDHPQLRHTGGVSDRIAEVGPIVEPAPLVRVTGAAVAAEDDRGVRVADDATGGPLAGATIVEFGTFYAAPFGTALAADLGARVIKVESLEGEPMRWMAGFPEAGAAKSLQGKESIALDLTTEAGHEIVLRLVEKADLVLQSYRAGVAERLGIDAATLQAANPGLVYLSSTGYGDDGPCGARPAFAPTIGAGAGAAMHNIGTTLTRAGEASDLLQIRRQSIRLGMATQVVGNADGCASSAVGTAVILGLWARATGRGGLRMSTTMLTTMANVLADDLLRYEGRPVPAQPDPELYGLGPTYRLYETAEGWVFLSAPTDPERDRLRGALGVAGLDAETLVAVFATRSAAEWEEILGAAGVGCVAVTRTPFNQTMLGGAGAAGGYVVEVEHPTFGVHPRMAPLTSMSRSATAPRAGCLLGQHTATILSEIGYDSEAIGDLIAEGVVRDG